MIIDEAIRILTNNKLEYDKDGEISSKGEIDKEILNELLSLEYFKQKPPKTTGRELFGSSFTKGLVEKCLNKKLNIETILSLSRFSECGFSRHLPVFQAPTRRHQPQPKATPWVNRQPINHSPERANQRWGF